MRMKKWIIMIPMVCVILAVMSSIGISWVHPVKYAVEEKNFSDYPEYILVREVHYTGTGWSVIGDAKGYLPSGEAADVILEGEELPEAVTPTENSNTFLCIAEYKGKKEHAAFEEKLDCYVIKDWYPVYPVVRNRLLPQFFYPRGYMTERDMKGY